MNKLIIPRQCVKQINKLFEEYKNTPGQDNALVARVYDILKPYVDYITDVVLLKKYDKRHTPYFLELLTIINGSIVIDEDEIAELIRKTENYYSLESIQAEAYIVFHSVVIAYSRIDDDYKGTFDAFFVKRMLLGLRDYFRKQYLFFAKTSRETELMDVSSTCADITDYYKEDVSGLFDNDNPNYPTFTPMDRYLLFLRLYEQLSWRKIRERMRISIRTLRGYHKGLINRFTKLNK